MSDVCPKTVRIMSKSEVLRMSVQNLESKNQSFIDKIIFQNEII